MLEVLSFSEGKSELGFSQNMVVVGFDRVDWLGYFTFWVVDLYSVKKIRRGLCKKKVDWRCLDGNWV